MFYKIYVRERRFIYNIYHFHHVGRNDRIRKIRAMYHIG